MSAPDFMAILTALVEAHATGDASGRREPVYFLRHSGGGSLAHPALAREIPGVDETALEDMHGEGLIDLEYTAGGFKITPTVRARRMIETRRRFADLPEIGTELTSRFHSTLDAQLAAGNPLDFSLVRAVLQTLRDAWAEQGFPADGVALPAVVDCLRDDHVAMFGLTVRALASNGYLDADPALALATGDDSSVPAVVSLTERTFAALDGWPGTSPAEAVEALLAALSVAAQEEPDPTKRRRLERVGETIRELGVSTASEVLSKVLVGA